MHRGSFSKSLLNHIKNDYPNLSLAKVYYHIGEPMSDRDSPTGLYALVNLKNDFILRVTPFKSLVTIWQNERVKTYEVHIEKVISYGNNKGDN